MTDDFTSWYLRTHEGMALRELSAPAARILDIFIKISFLIERKEARVTVLGLLAAAAKLHKGNLARYISELEKGDVISEREEDGSFYYEINPNWTAWKVPRRHTYKEEGAMERALRELIDIGKSDPGQIEFSARGFDRDDFEGEVSRAFAGASRTGMAVVHGTTDPSQNGKTVVHGTTSGGVVRCTTARPPEGVVPRTTDPPCSEHEEHDVQNMIHEHASRRDGGEEGRNPSLNALTTSELEARLDGERLHTLEQMAELPGVTDPKFLRTWLLRLSDRNYRSVVSAVGEALHKKRTGFRPNKSWGQYLNDVFHRSRAALREAGKGIRSLL
jgi:hypothetical protein